MYQLRQLISRTYRWGAIRGIFTSSNGRSSFCKYRRDSHGIVFDADSPDDDRLAVNGVDVAAEQCTEVTYNNSVCSVGLGNLDLGNMVNGYPGNPVELRHFDHVFQTEKNPRVVE